MDTQFEKDIMEAVETADLREDLREEKRRDRARHSSTFKTLAAQVDRPVSEWDKDLLDEVIEDTIVIERDRKFERGIWTFVVLALAGAGALAGWHLKPEPEQEPILWSCTRTYDNIKVDTIECKGVDF